MSHSDSAPPRISGLHASWQVLGSVPCAALVEPRGVVERAVRVVGAVAQHVTAPGEPGAELEWLSSHHALASPVLRGSRGVRAALRPAELTLSLLDTDGVTVRTCPLEHCTVHEAITWLRTQLGDLGVDVQALAAPSAGDPTAEGALGRPDREALAELERWLVNADHVLRTLARTTHGASPVRGPADRLELSTVIDHSTREGEGARRVVVGVSLGDDRHPEVHLFVEALPATGGSEGWEAAGEGQRIVLSGSEVLRGRDAAAQTATVDRFLQSAIAEAHGLLHREWRRR
jgi:hypothetical protein